MSYRLPEGMEKSSIGRFATFATAIAVVNPKIIEKFLQGTNTDDRETAEKFITEAKFKLSKALENYWDHCTNERVKEFRDVTDTDEVTAKLYVYKAKDNVRKAVENYNVKQFCDVTETDRETAKWYLKKTNVKPGRTSGKHLQIAMDRYIDDKKIFEVALKTNEKTAKQFLDEAYGDINRAICNFNIKSFRDVTDTDEVTAEKFLREADGKYGSTSGRYNVTMFLELAGDTTDVKYAMTTFKKAEGGTPVADHPQIAIDRYLNEFGKFLELADTIDKEVAKFYLNKAYGADEYKNLSVRRCTQEAIKEYKLSKLNKYTRRR